MRYIPLTDQEKQEMLEEIGVESVDELFEDIPSRMLLKEPLPLPAALSEAELIRHFQELAAKNVDLSQTVSFLGGGAYDHLIPSIIKHIAGRGEYLTAYTPYQAEISQGVLQSIFEFQGLIAELTGMEAANASIYDGATALAEAALMACAVTGRKKVLLPATLHPEWKEVAELYLKSQDLAVEYIPYDPRKGTLDPAALEKTEWSQFAGAVVQQPNFFGLLEEAAPVSQRIREQGGLFIMAVDAISLGLLKSPGELGADIAVGDGQSLGNTVSFGGPSLGFFATSGSKLIRRMPGRVVGETVDKEGRRGFVLTLQTREQHIRRERATSNICSNQALNAFISTIYLSVLGKKGFQDVAFQNLQKSNYFQQRLLEIGGLSLKFSAPSFREFVIRGDVDWEEMNLRLLEHGFIGGLPLKRFGFPQAALFAVTEARTKEEMDAFINVFRGLI
ncbi:MAG: aminomethyl-transferring glycine dehydrogenase subunit GcvPA [Firmicutes bacterium]|nr:aminomethyl-transferring glycine dehydrogenase subunit GcvPA [Bacillota bacterium]